MNSFFERYQPVFEVVARLLGNGWRVNLLDDCRYRIKLTTPELKRYVITVREEKNRLVIYGFVESRQWSGNGAQCTVSLSREVTGIANDIRCKILPLARKEIENALKYEKNIHEQQEKKQILKGMLAQLVQLESWYGALTGFKTENGLSGKITEQGDCYDFVVRDLNIDQLVKLTGMIKQL
ncbi:hypothetical protein DCF83_18030 (plasmid) [Edwardsiella tarda]|uniref:hypothetical protein n=1 Tax=Edwardsiella tarda TaxID=636 RepID=UPI000D51BB63|nr:hypothetical protein [Edwardsiella tarda]UCQ29618.1 hypothetical protein DCF83_18030 [Edwardsiella tarda]